MTTAQIQHLLSYLHGQYPGAGFGPGPADGIPGPRTEAAIAAFQRAAPGNLEENLRRAVAEGLTLPEKKDFWQDIQYFTREEFRCRCGLTHAPYCDGFPAEPQETLVRLADRGRKHFGVSAIVTSGLRCPRHNSDSGGVKNSRHLTGRALDFYLSGVSGERALSWFLAQPETRYAYAVEGNVIHIDVD